MSQQDKQPLRQVVNFRKAVMPVLPIIATCGNCKQFAFDGDDRMGVRGLYIEKKNKRCMLNEFSITLKSVCDVHEFKYSDKSDV